MHLFRNGLLRTTQAAVALSAVTAFSVMAPTTARACGGFFCGQQPVDQTAERIVFRLNGDGTTDMIVQISYSGTAEDFAWILPTASVPTLESLGTFPQLALNGLDTQTAPRFIPPDDCFNNFLRSASGVPNAEVDDSTMDVNVLLRAEVGPYDVAVVNSEDPNALVAWLRANDFRVTSPMEPYIRVYTQEGMNFLALKLRRGQDVSDIQPFRMGLNGESPSIPIRLTSVAAEPEMGIAVYILADRRFGPANWADLLIDDRDIVWSPTRAGTNWTALVSRGADAFGGHGFVTEFAGATAPLAEAARQSPTFGDDQIEAQAALTELLDSAPYISRLYARLSPEEMTLDPVFRRVSGGDVSNQRQLPRYVGGDDVCMGDDGFVFPFLQGGGAGVSVCDFASCGPGGTCRETVGPDGQTYAGCACAPGAAARAYTGPNGQVAVTCQDLRLSFLNPGDRETPDSEPLPDPCLGVSCGEHGRCVNINMATTCECDQGYVAIGQSQFVDGQSQRNVSCQAPQQGVSRRFYDEVRLPALPAELPGGREVSVPPVVRHGSCAISPRSVDLSSGVFVLLGLLGTLVYRRRLNA